MRYINAKPEFERVDQIFIPIVEATATLPHILSEVKQNAGEDYVIVTGDGLEVKESSGTEGFKFWKVSARKFYAIPEDDLRPADARGVKRSRTAAESQAQLLMGRQLRTTLPQVPDKMNPKWPYLRKFRVQDQKFKLQQKANFA
eukprot:Em0012g639a